MFGIRKYRIIDISVFDVIITMILGIFISDILNIQLYIIFFILLIMAISIHRIFNIPTMLNYYLGLNTKKEVLDNR
jgi:hypothetical protein